MELNHLGLVDDARPVNTPSQEKAHKTEQAKFLATVPHTERMSKSEHVAMRKEENAASVKKYKFNKQNEITKDRLGQILHENTILRKLQQINSNFTLNEWSAGGRRGLGIRNPLNGEVAYTGVSLQAGYSPEYETVRYDDYGLPTNSKYRGWRTVLLNLIRAQFITEDDANRVFGPALGPEAHRYNRQLWEIRNKRPYDG